MADTKMRILIVDDSVTMRQIMRNLLKQLDFTNVEEAGDGSTAIKKLKTDTFDFVITDWHMPKVTGLELIKAIRADEKTKNTPILMVTAEADKENVIQAAQVGVNDYVVKPFSAETLQGKIDKRFG
jgi:two-component system chemotaxis response regulator CheY